MFSLTCVRTCNISSPTRMEPFRTQRCISVQGRDKKWGYSNERKSSFPGKAVLEHCGNLMVYCILGPNPRRACLHTCPGGTCYAWCDEISSVLVSWRSRRKGLKVYILSSCTDAARCCGGVWLKLGWVELCRQAQRAYERTTVFKVWMNRRVVAFGTMVALVTHCSSRTFFTVFSARSVRKRVSDSLAVDEGTEHVCVLVMCW